MRVRDGILKLFGLCVLAGVLVAGMLFPVAGSLGVVSNRASEAVNSISTKLVTEQPPLVTTVTDRAGNPIAYLYDQYRVPVASDQIADTMKAAMVAIEDQRFYEHQGVDWPGTVRAFVTNRLAGQITQGASTITQQYVKNYLVHVVAADNPVEQADATEQTVARKLREIRIALQLEKRLGKEQILTRYLNVVPFGNEIYGVGAAAQAYFDTSADKLTIPQAALLAGIVNKPGSLNPLTNPADAMFRRNLVIDAMAKQNRITPEAARRARAAPLGVQAPLTGLPNGCVGAGPANGMFCKYAVAYLERAGFSTEQLKKGGYRITTTLDQKITADAKKAAERGVPQDSPGIANVMTVVEPGQKKHRVRALVANRDFGFDPEKGQSAYALPSSLVPFGAGSVYKTFTAAAALEKGMGIYNVIPAPSSYTSVEYSNGTAPYTVGNAQGVSSGPRTLQDALATSPNTAFIMLQEKAGLNNTVNMAVRLGLRQTMLHHTLSGQPVKPAADEPNQAEEIKEREIGAFTLGFSPVNPLELANVAATIMSGGQWCPPTPIKQIVDRHGNVVSITESPCEQVVDEELAHALAVGMSKDTIEGGTAARAAADVGWNRPTAAKTGTTENFKSAAFIGATAHFAGAAMTFSDRTNPTGICLGDPPTLCGEGNIYGGTIPAHTWMWTMKPAHEGLPRVPLPPVTDRYANGGTGNQVPDVVGLNTGQAVAKLEDAGYKVKKRSVNSQRPQGLVISQTPRGFALKGTRVLLSVSTGYVPPPETQSRKPEPTEPEPEPTEDEPKPSPPRDEPDGPEGSGERQPQPPDPPGPDGPPNPPVPQDDRPPG